MEKIIKRDGSIVPFDKGKIEIAISKAFLEVDGIPNEEVSVKIAEKILRLAKSSEDYLTVEDIQDLVENELINSGCDDVAKAYIKYRYLHNMARKKYSELIGAISEKLNASNVQNQNANVDEYSFGGRIGEASDLIMRKYALDYCVSPMARENHLNNEIYIHDLNAYAVGSHNCLSVPFDDLLAKGFNTRQTDVRPANSVNTAFQLVAVIFQVQSLQQFGGVSATHLDWTMVPYVRKSFYKHLMDGYKYLEGIENPKSLYGQETSDSFWTQYVDIEDKDLKECHPKAWRYAMDMTEKETYQAVEGMYHNLK